MGFFAKAFPVIDIVRALRDAAGDPRVHGEVDREVNPSLIAINGIHFDVIKAGLADGINIGHYFYFLIATIVHELSHYSYDCASVSPTLLYSDGLLSKKITDLQWTENWFPWTVG